MAYYANALSFFFVIVLFSSSHIQARESKFFAKTTIHTTTKNPTAAATHVHQAELLAPVPSPAEAPAQTESGYGLYGQRPQGSDFLPAETTTTAAATTNSFVGRIPTGGEVMEENNKVFHNNGYPNEGEFPVGEIHGESNQKEFNNNGLPSNYNEKAYVTVPQELSDSRSVEKSNYVYDPRVTPTTSIPATTNTELDKDEFSYRSGYTNGVTKPQGLSDTRFNNNGLPSNYNEKAYVTVPQELSDSRSVEKGNYVYDPRVTPTTSTPASTNTELHKDEFSYRSGYTNGATKPQGLSDARFVEKDNYFFDPEVTPTTSAPTTTDTKLYKDAFEHKYKGNRVSEPQGMSDTRFMQNRKYYHDHMADGNYGSVKESVGNNNEGASKNEGYFGNIGEKSKYEFDSMEEFERSEGYTQSEGAFEP